jgi:hypothetical protein
MADTDESTPRINRWPDQPTVPPSRPVFAEATAEAAIVTPLPDRRGDHDARS